MNLFRYLSIFTFLIAHLFFTGCSQTHSVTIDPALPVSRSDIGKNKPVGFKIIDSRPSNLISKWKGRFNFRSFRIAPDGDLAEALHQKIEKGLQILGFIPRRYSIQQSRALTVEILKLKSVYHEKRPQRGVRIDSVIRAQCNNKNQTYKMDYRERITRNAIAPTSFPNESLVNAAISGALKKMFADPRLLKCLMQ
jgi:uncharacterized lipoprotein YajG